MRKQRPIQYLCSRWNEATCPWALRSDHEHRRYRQLAKALENNLERFYSNGRHYRELDNGSLRPITLH